MVDRTGLSGHFSFDLKFAQELRPTAAPAATAPDAPPTDDAGPSLFTALQQQLGLKLNSTRGPVEVLVIDSAEQPTPD